MATSKIPITTGSGLNISTISYSEDAVTKELQRIIISDTAGGSLGLATSPFFATGTMSVANVLSASNVTIASIATGTVNVVNTVAVTGTNFTIASITTGTMNVINVLSASGVTIASIGTGLISISGAPTVSLVATTASVGAFIGTAHSSHWNAFAVNTTSGASTIVKTSGASTLYITSLLVSVDHGCRVDLYSAATTLMSVYLASNGGFALPVSAESPLVLNSAQSLTFTPSVSGSAMCYAAGYTVT